ncbi:MAG: hypothetical protein LLG05_18760 [Porphyromonadaceae bacterium]|nr:hypothetical protein [Porphyromonadaceae bacterium]
MRYGKKVTTYMLLFIAVFIVASLIITALTGYENASLNALVGGFASIEGGILGFLKHFERKNKNE